MTRPERILVWLLRLSGGLLLTALIPVVMPFAWMMAIHRELGLGELPQTPIVGYLTRSLSLLYALHGALLFWISGDIRRYLPLLKFLILIGFAFGASMTVLDWAVGMPLSWILGEGPWIMGGSLLLWWLARRPGSQQE